MRRIIEGRHVTIRLKGGADLDPWIDQARPSLVAAFANGVAKDITAVRAAIVSHWPNGQTEGHAGRKSRARGSGFHAYLIGQSGRLRRI